MDQESSTRVPPAPARRDVPRLPEARLQFGQRLSHKVQFILLGFIVAPILAGFIAGPPLLHMPGLDAATEKSPGGKSQAAAPGQPKGRVFKPTDRQWSSLKIQTVEDRTFQDTTEADGKVALNDETPVFSPYSGKVTRLIARAGDTVQRGDPLFAVESPELAEAQSDLITACSNLKTARARLILATTNEKRQHELYLAQGAALKDWQQSRVDLATAQAGMNNASIALSAVRSRLQILGQTDKDIGQIEATPDLVRLDAETVVRAPIAGIVMQRRVGLGQTIISASSGASEPVFTIGNLSKLWLIADAREDDAPYLHKGDPVDVRVPAFPDRVIKARLVRVAASIDPNTHHLLVRAEAENPLGDLQPGMLASFRIITGNEAINPAVPQSAVVYAGDAAHVWVADDKTRALVTRPIRPGRSRDGMIEVLDGLKSGERIVTSGGIFFDPAATDD
jgi:cobalt-zinc-cadmium efflux system membrane fusion protein